ncbi:hypothetical protein CSC19_3522 [Enterobacter hormaechei]|nr:hypothetical protein CSC19_3522 [Enterobacter hormaechei]
MLMSASMKRAIANLPLFNTLLTYCQLLNIPRQQIFQS